MKLRFLLHAFSHHHQTQRPRHAQDGCGDGLVVFADGNAAHKAAVDLDFVNGHAAQVGQRGIAGPEVIDTDPKTTC
uniref:hypothetical protein n=1 Tax=Hydrogenophaga sp. OTU3427 TaxID=3043856 RepID=UPI00313D9C97